MLTHSQRLTGGRTIHQFMGNASNIYIINDNRQKGTFLVDCGMWSDKALLIKALQPMPPLKQVVCTHFHVDHVGNVRAHGGEPLQRVKHLCFFSVF